MTELVVQDDLRRLVAAGKISLPELMERLAKAAPEPEGDTQEKPKPKAVVLSAADKKILRTLPAQLAELSLPEHARKLTESERAEYVPLFDRVKQAAKAITKAEDALKEAMHGHIDSITEGPLDKNGHKVSEGEVVAPSYDKKVVRGLVGGNGVEITDSDLQAMEAEGLITHARYLRMTKVVPATRVPVGDAIMAEISKDSSLLPAFAAKARKSDVGTAIRMAKS